MVQRENRNLEIVKEFKKKIEKIGAEKIIFYGSRARGDFRLNSDFDLIIVSKKFEGVKWHRRPLEIYLTWSERFPLEVLCYTPKEFKRIKSKIGVVREAVKEGIEI